MRVAANGTGGCGDVTAQLDLLLHHVLHGFVIDADEDQVSRLPACLKAEAGASDLHEDRRAPAVSGAACGEALSILATDHERTFLIAGHDSNALGFGGDPLWHALVRCGHQLVDDGGGGIDAIVEFLDIGRGGGHAGEHSGDAELA